jgi:hypothetical protein
MGNQNSGMANEGGDVQQMNSGANMWRVPLHADRMRNRNRENAGNRWKGSNRWFPRDVNHGWADRLSQSRVVGVGGIWWHRMMRRGTNQDTLSLTV